MDWRDKWIGPIGAALVSSMLSMALTMMICQALDLDAGAGIVTFSCLVTGTICAIGTTSRKGTIFACAVTIVIIAILAMSKARLFASMGGLVAQVAALTTGAEASINEYSSTLAVFIGVVLTAFLFWLADMDGGVYPALALCIVLLMCVWLLSGSIDTMYSFIAAASLACMFARAADGKTSYLRAVPAAIIVALLAIMLLPSGNPTWPPLEQAAQKVRDMFNDYFFFTDPRTTYSISSDGFQPMGEVLGGPAKPDMSNVMIVETDDTLLLRGSIKRAYTTYAWTESAINSRYVFIDPIRRQVREEVFDIDKLSGLDTSGALKRINAFVTVVNSGISTLFVPHRLIDLNIPIDLAAYFSTSGEVFITRGVQPQDTYGIDAYIQTGDTRSMRRLVNEAEERPDGKFEQVKQAYTALPTGIETQVYQLVQSIIQNAITPYDKALALEKHLLENYQYKLDVNYPPRNRDFVSFFLLQSKKGYCSYFASAMAVMARIAGLPSRYVEGYMVPARPNGTTLVTGKNAHAWVEIYFKGIGWVTFNPTPGSGDSYSPSGSSAGDSGQDDEQDDYAGEADQPHDAEPTPTVAPEGGEDGAHDDQEGSGDNEDEPDDEGENEDDADESDEASDEASQASSSGDSRRNFWWLVLLIPLIAAIAFLLKRLKDSDPSAMTHNMDKVADKLLTWYRAILLALEYQGQTPNAGETPMQFAARLSQAKITDDALTTVANQVSLNRYAKKRPDATALRQARQAYAQLVSQFKPVERVRWYCHRVVRGIGDIKNIP